MSYIVVVILMENPQKGSWTIEKVASLDALEPNKMLPRLASGDIGVVRIPNFFSRAEVDRIVERISTHEISWYPNFTNKQGRIGICATEYVGKEDGKSAYFAREPECSRVRDDVFSNVPDPIQKLISGFSADYETSVAREPEMESAEYFAGLIRAMQQKSTLHFDYAPQQTPEWWVSGIEAQFAIVVYLQLPGNGGGLTVYDRRWVPEDDVYNQDGQERGAKGYDPVVAETLRSVTVNPEPGEMVIFNSRNFHQVEAIDADLVRLSLNVFLGLKDNRLYLWN